MNIMNPTTDQLSEWMAQYYPPQPSRRLSDLALSPRDQAALMADLQQTQDPENAAIMQQMAQQQMPAAMPSVPPEGNFIQRTGGQPIPLQSIQQQGGMSLNDLLNKTGASINDKVIIQDKGVGYRTPYGSVAGLDSNGRMWEMDKPQTPKVTVKQMKEYWDMVKAQKEAQGGDAKPVFHEGQWVYPPSQANPAGQAVPVGGFKKAPTEDERKTSYNVGRILQSAKMVQDVAAKDKGSLAPGVVEAAAGVAPLWDTAQEGLKNLSRSSNRQIVNQSQADIIDSLLFLATGAAYNKEQLAQQRASYQPNFTDSPEAVNAKNERMQGLIEAAKVRAGNAWTPEMDAALNVLSIPKMETGKRTSSRKIGGAPVPIRSDDDYARLPSGTVFTGPDGVKRRKP